MTKQKIIEIANKNLGYNYNNGVIPYITDKGAEKLLTEFEKEKKATIKLILLGFQCALDEKQPERAVEETILRIAERYGVEL